MDERMGVCLGGTSTTAFGVKRWISTVPEVRAFIERCRAGDVSNEETSERRGFREKRTETPEREPCGK